MRRRVKASSAGPLSLVVLAAVFLSLTLAATSMASKGFVGLFGTPGLGAAELHSISGVAINNAGSGPGADPGDVYVVGNTGLGGNSGDNSATIKQFGQYGEFVRQFGWDVTVVGPGNTGANEQQTVDIPPAVTGGTFQLTLTSGSGPGSELWPHPLLPRTNQIIDFDVRRGVFQVGDTIAGGGFFTPLEPGTILDAIDPNTLAPTTLTLSKLVTNGATTEHFASESTAALSYNATAATVQAALAALPAVGPGNVTVTGGPGASGTPFTITFTGGFVGHNDLPPLTIKNSLTGAVPSNATITNGGGPEVCNGSIDGPDACRPAAQPGISSVAGSIGSVETIAADPSSGNLFVFDKGNNRVSVFRSDGIYEGAFGWGVATGASQLEFCTSACQAGTTGEGAGQIGGGFSSRTLAIDPATGNLLVADAANRRVSVFNPTLNGSDEVVGVDFELTFGRDVVASGPDDTGTGFEVCNVALNPTDVCKAGSSGTGVGEFSSANFGPLYVAADSAGVIYTTEENRAQSFTPSGSTFVPAVFVSAALAGGQGFRTVAAGSANHVFIKQVFPAGSSICPDGAPNPREEHRVIEVDSTGALIDVHGVCSGVHSYYGLAENSASGDLYMDGQQGQGEDPAPRGVVILGESSSPTSAIDAVTPNTGGATLELTLNPNGPLPVYPNRPSTSYQVEYKRAIDSTWTKFGPAIDIGGGFADTHVTRNLGGLDAHTVYDVRVAAVKSGVAPGIDTATFETLPIAPTIDAFSATGVTATSADLNASINAHGEATTYYFEYGTTAEYGLKTEEAPLGESLDPEPVQEHIENLDSVVYHFRVVATNAFGTVTSKDQTFTYLPPPCPNEAVRQQMGSAYLPDCRAYELVSPSNAGNVELLNSVNVAPYATSPARFGFYGRYGALPGTNPTLSGFDSYVATRTATGWETTYPGIPGSQNPASAFGGAAPDLSKFIFFYGEGEYLGGGNGRVSRAPWVYDYRGAPLGRWPSNLDSIPGGDTVRGAFQPSPDFSHLIFSSNNIDFDPQGEGLTTAPGSAYDYDVETGTTTLISIAPNGGPIQQEPGVLTDTSEFIRFGHQSFLKTVPFNPAVSTDGSHVVMTTAGTLTSGGPTRIYMRANGVTYDLTRGQYGRYVGMVSDGTKVFFTTDAQLASVNSPQDSDQSTDLYMWSEQGDTLTRVSTGDAGTGNTDACVAPWTTLCGVAPVISGGVDTDYPIATERGDVYFYSPELLDGTENGVEAAQNLYVYRDGETKFVAALKGDGSMPATAFQVSSDGAHAALITRSRLTAYDNAGFSEMYSVDPESGEVLCVSCIPSGNPPTHHVQGSATGFFMSDDGRTFFSTRDALVAQDTNEGGDVYEYVEGRPQLISSGTNETHINQQSAQIEDTTLAAVSADGVNVYFATFDTLVPQDENGPFRKFYVARTNGGFPVAPYRAPCEAADECHGPASTPPAPPPIVSSNHLGQGGNVASKRNKKRKQRRQKKRRHRSAKTHRGGGSHR